MRRWEHRSARAETDRRDSNHLFLLGPQKYQNWIQPYSPIFYFIRCGWPTAWTSTRLPLVGTILDILSSSIYDAQERHIILHTIRRIYSSECDLTVNEYYAIIYTCMRLRFCNSTTTVITSSVLNDTLSVMWRVVY